MDWFKRKITGNTHMSWDNLWFPISYGFVYTFPLHQSMIDVWQPGGNPLHRAPVLATHLSTAFRSKTWGRKAPKLDISIGEMLGKRVNGTNWPGIVALSNIRIQQRLLEVTATIIPMFQAYERPATTFICPFFGGNPHISVSFRQSILAGRFNFSWMDHLW